MPTPGLQGALFSCWPPLLCVQVVLDDWPEEQWDAVKR